MSTNESRRIKRGWRQALAETPFGVPASAWGRWVNRWSRRGGHEGASLHILLNSVALILSKVATMGFGFLSWLLAARLFAAADVGLASGAISAINLCVQIALLGISSAVISLFPQHQQQPASLLNTSVNIVTVAALASAGLFLLLASGVFQELSVVAADLAFTLAFLGMSVFGSLGVLFDQTSTVLRRGHQVLVRGVLTGVVTLSVLALLPLVAGTASSFVIFSAWVIGGLFGCAVGGIQVWRSLAQYRYRIHIERRIAGQLLGIGIPNWALSVAERAPAPLMSIVVTELLSPADNAYWYAVWMMAWLVFIVPIQIGINLFAEAAHRPEALEKVIRHGTRSSLAFGAIGAVGLAVIAPFILSLLGRDYVIAGTTPLRILVIAVLPFTFVQMYFAACRATRRLREAILTGIVGGVISVGGAVTVGLAYGLSGMAVAWLVAQFATSVWAIWRLRLIAQRAWATSTPHSS